MGLIGTLIGTLFGGDTGRNRIVEAVEAFRPNAEADAVRTAALGEAALAQFGAEFLAPKKGWFDRFIDGLNRLPRPAMALGTLGLFVAAMVDPVWFAERMAGIALVPEPLWWLLGAIVSFYFGARHQAKAQDFQKGVAEMVRRMPVPTAAKPVAEAAEAAPEEPVSAPSLGGWAVSDAAARDNAALADWKRAHGL